MKRLLLLTPLLLGACVATPPNAPSSAQPSATTEPPPLDAKAAQVKAMSAEIPEWYVNPPTDGRSLYAAGTGDSGDMEFALDKAVLSAKRALADRVNGSVSARQNEYVAESSGDAKPVQVSSRTTTNRITDVVLNGYTVIQTKLVPSDQSYRAFVLLRFPIANAAATPSRVATRDTSEETKTKAAQAFEELQKDIDATAHDGAAKDAAAQADVPKDAAPQEVAKNATGHEEVAKNATGVPDAIAKNAFPPSP